MKQIGLYSGTFDPIHMGHIAFANEARSVCGLDKVVFLPERSPRWKQGVTDISHRLALIKAAILEESSHLTVSRLKSARFTVAETLPELRTAFKGSCLTLLVGSDVVRTLCNWEGLDVLLQEVSLAVGIRGGDDPTEVRRTLDGLSKLYGFEVQYTCIQTSQADVSSSQIRDGGASLRLLPAAAREYIYEHELYSYA